VLKAKLDQKGIAYENVTDINVMTAKGFAEAPKLEVGDRVMNFKEAIEWIGEQ
jgi:hypothetical protein